MKIEGEIPRDIVKSTNLRSVGYDEAKQLLQVEFKTGQIFNYAPVSALHYHLLKGAASKGVFLNSHIKRNDKIICSRLDQGKRMSIDVPMHVVAPLYLALLQTKKLVKAGGAFCYSLWCCTGKEPGNTEQELYSRALQLIAEASCCNNIGAEHLDAAIALAKERKI